VDAESGSPCLYGRQSRATVDGMWRSLSFWSRGAGGLLGAVVVCAALPFTVTLLGYGRYLKMTWLVPVSVIAFLCVLHAILVIRTPTWRRSRWYALLPLVLLSGGFFTGWGVGALGRDVHCRSICSRSEPILAALEAYRAQHGQYPANLGLLPNIDDLKSTARLNLTEGVFAKGKRNIDVGAADVADAVLYLDRDNWICLVPIERPVMLSFTRFCTYRRDNGYPSWEPTEQLWWLGSAD
jgi:hypothetical protein